MSSTENKEISAAAAAAAGSAGAGIRVEREGAVLRIAFDRPERRHAITLAMYTAMCDALATASDPASDIKVVLIHGDARAFTAGNDLVDFANSAPSDSSSPAMRFLAALAGFKVPLVAAVCGPAVGIGSTLLLHCDLVYAGDNAAFSFPFVNLGLCPEAGSSVLLPALVGRVRAGEKLLFGESFGADEALSMGLINKVLPADETIPHAVARCRELAQRPMQSLRVTRSLMRQGTAALVEQAMRGEGEAFTRMLHEPAAREAITAFMQKRKPDFDRL